jgi:RNA polymerase sigma-70 factor (TIGR02960 family)
VQDDALGEGTLARARAGDEEAFRELTDPHRRELQLHCYRILGTMQDAEDLVQETLLAAWRGLEAFEGRASVRSWLYQIPDALLDEIPDRTPGPSARYEAKEASELAFMVALQHLPPRQRAALVLRDVLGFPTAEIAEMLDTGEASVKGVLQRARATVETRLPAADRDRAPRPNSARERELAGRFANAVESGDIDEVVALLTDDALLTMPPQPLEYQGQEAIGAFLRWREEERGAPLRVVATRANTQPAFGCYLPDADAGIARPRGLFVLTLDADAVAALTWFADTAVFRHFGLPQTLPA